MAINKVIFGNQTLMDTTGVTVTPNTMTRGTTALAANGETITGALDTAPLYNDLDKTSEGYALDARQGKALNDKIIGLGDPVTVAHGGTGASTVDGARTVLDVYSKNEIEEKINLYSTAGPSSIVTIDDAIDDNAKDLTVDIEPVQDLHGYDYPWPGGGGKNLCFEESINNHVIATVKSGKTYTFSLKNTGDVGINLKKNNSNGEVVAYAPTTTASRITLTFTANEDYNLFINGFVLSGGGAFATYVSEYQLEEGSSATSYAPYSNICPISGWTGANVSATGKNLLKVEGKTISTIIYSVDSEGYVTQSPNNSNPLIWEYASRFGSAFLKAGNYKLFVQSKIKPTTTYAAQGILLCDSNNNNLCGSAGNSAIFPANGQTSSISFTLTKDSSVGLCSKLYDGSVRFWIQKADETSTDYLSYTGTTIPISWQSEAGTVYGGTLDVTTGVLTVTMAEVDLGTLMWRRLTEAVWNCFYSTGMINLKAAGLKNFVCSRYPQSNMYGSQTDKIICGNANNAYMYIRDSAYMDGTEEAFKTAMSGVQLVYELATPQTYQLSPTEIQLLLGYNNVWVDTGDTTITYRRNDSTGINREILNLQKDTAKSVIYTNQQSLTNAQKEIVRSNIGAASQTDVETAQTTANNAVKYNAAQTLTTAQKAQARANIGAEAAGVVSSARPLIYCWGDSLTEGVGGYVMMPDGANAYMAYSYPAWLGQTWDVVNMGARSEDCHAIMARQGADPIVIQTGFTIPASKDTPVEICSITQIYNTTTGTGFTSRSEALVKINKEVESPGLNPCTINGVEGIIYREMTSSALNNETTYKYYFKRLEDGAAMNVAAGTEIKTYAMNHCRNGVAIIWMGMNGGYTSVSDYLTKIRTMVTYGQYSNYLVIISREFSGSDLETIKAELTDNSGFCHVIDLMAQLPYRGYAMAGIPFLHVDTSGWSTTDPVKKHAPLLCEYLSGQTGENQYGTLHYSAWGYKAIAKLVNEKLLTMNLTTGGNETPTGDSYGTYLYKLAAPRSLSGTNYLNTHVKLFDDVSKNWTMAIKWSGTVSCPNGYPANVFCCAKDGAWKGVLYRYYAAQGANLLFGSGAMNVDGANNATDNWGGTNIVIIAKSGDAYNVYCNSTNKVYGTTLTYTLSANDAIDLPLIVGARYNAEGTEVQYKTAMMLGDLRIYDAALDDTDCQALYAELAGA